MQIQAHQPETSRFAFDPAEMERLIRGYDKPGRFKHPSRRTLMDALEVTSVSRVPQGRLSRQDWVELLGSVIADGTAIHTTTTETAIFSNISLAAGYFYQGRVMRIRSFGKLSTTGTPTITFALRLTNASGTLLATTEAITNGSGVTNAIWSYEIYVVCRSVGSSGSLLVFGDVIVNTSATAAVVGAFGVSGFDAPAVVTVDTTAAIDLCQTADWSANSASNTLTGMFSTPESLN